MKITSIIAIFLLISTILSSCAQASEKNIVTADEQQTAEETAAETLPEETVPQADLPDKKYGGMDFNTLIRSEWLYEFKIEEETGETVDDAVYVRNRAVEERFDINFNFIDIPGTWSAKDSFSKIITSSILAGDAAHDMIASYQAYLVDLAMSGNFINVYDIPYIDTVKPWWSKLATDSLTLGGCLYFITGDITTTFWENIYVMFYSKSLANDYGIEDINALVTSGKWTVDKLAELSKLISEDIDGDGKFTAADKYGYATSIGNHARANVVTLQCPITSAGDDGLPHMSFAVERTVNAIDKVLALVWDDSTYTDSQFLTEPIPNGTPDIFIEGRVLFADAFLGCAELLRDMETDFGIIPRPKYDEAQDNYYTTLHNSVSMICFPITVRDAEMSGIIAEALCAESYMTTKPAIYETALKTKYTRDETSSAMIDLIRDTIVFDFGWVHSTALDTIGTLFQNIIDSKKNGFMSEYAKKADLYESKLQKVIENYTQR